MFRIQTNPAGTAHRRSKRTTLLLEPLEGRITPAGVVNATFTAGVLTITAVNDPTDVNITNTNHQNITLDGAGANNFTVIANDGETGTAITGSPFNGVESIKFVMGLGNDTVTLTDANLGGAVTFLGGSGDNHLNIDGAGNISGLVGASPGNVTIGSLSVTGGDGIDKTEINGGNHQVTGNVTIANGAGDSNVRFGTLAADETTVGGTTKITNLAGYDVFQAFGTTATFTGAITISNGNGGGNGGYAGLTNFAAGTNTLTGGITVTNGDGDDAFTANGTTFTVGAPTARKNMTINNGTGYTQQNFRATTNTINGNITVTGSEGNDACSVDGDNFNVLGNVKISAGNGRTSTSISPAQVVDIEGAVTVTAGEGADTLDFNGGASVDVGSVSFSSGNGQSNLDFNGATTTINGTITSTHGDGTDRFNVSGANFTSAAITIRNGHGNGDTRIDAGTSNTILGNISITNGDGYDEFSAGGSNFTLGTPTARRNLTIRNGDGGSETEFDATNTIHGNIAVTNGSGFDEFDVSGNAFAVTGTGNVTIANGVGGSDSLIDANTSSSIGGKLAVTASDGDDVVQLLRVTVSGPTSITTGNGNDDVTLDSSTFNGLLTITLGAGADSIFVEDGSADDSVVTTFNAAVKFNTGDGDDQVLIGVLGDADDFGDFNAAVTITGGLDLDIIQALANVANTFAIPPIISGFEQGT